MIISIAPIDGINVLTVVDTQNPINYIIEGQTPPGEYLTMRVEFNVDLSLVVRLVPEMPSLETIKSIAFEEERNLYHVATNDGKISSYPQPKGHPMIDWMNKYKAEIRQVVVNEQLKLARGVEWIL